MNEARLPGVPENQQLQAMQNLMSGLIDYAGLFPPSQLPLAEAITNYARFRGGQDAWMLSRFIIPATMLADLDVHADLFKYNPPFRFAVTFKGDENYDQFLKNLAGTVALIKSFEEKYGDQVSVEMIEGRLPVAADGSHNPETLNTFFARTDQVIISTLNHPLKFFFEIPWNIQFSNDINSTYNDLFDHAASAIRRHNEYADESRCQLGFKLRCGGVDPNEVPSPEIVASALSHVIRTDIPFKATAGLHHPIRRYHQEFGGFMHGFLNVFGAGVLGKAHGLSQSTLVDIISDIDADHFRSTSTDFTWKNYSVELNDLYESRSSQFISYGSCSFDEPREDLVDLGLLR